MPPFFFSPRAPVVHSAAWKTFAPLARLAPQALALLPTRFCIPSPLAPAPLHPTHAPRSATLYASRSVSASRLVKHLLAAPLILGATPSMDPGRNP